MTTKAFSTAALASLTSGVLLCKFGEMQAAAEYLMGHPIWTHELASKPLWDLMRSKLLEQHPALPSDPGDLGDDGWQNYLAALCAMFGETLTITKGEEIRAADPITTARAMLGPDKPIVVVCTGEER